MTSHGAAQKYDLLNENCLRCQSARLVREFLSVSSHYRSWTRLSVTEHTGFLPGEHIYCKHMTRSWSCVKFTPGWHSPSAYCLGVISVLRLTLNELIQGTAYMELICLYSTTLCDAQYLWYLSYACESMGVSVSLSVWSSTSHICTFHFSRLLHSLT